MSNVRIQNVGYRIRDSRWAVAGVGVFAVSFLWILNGVNWEWERLWVTEEQAFHKALIQGSFEEAIQLSGDPFKRGFAYYKNGEFKLAEVEFSRLNAPEAAFNLGNARAFQGKYEEAIDAYTRALEFNPGWKDPQWNIQICEARLLALALPDDDAGGTGGKLEADEIVFGDRPNPGPRAEEQAVEMGGEALSNEEMRALWLRRVQTRPADFLKYKFAFQAREGGGL